MSQKSEYVIYVGKSHSLSYIFISVWGQSRENLHKLHRSTEYGQQRTVQRCQTGQKPDNNRTTTGQNPCTIYTAASQIAGYKQQITPESSQKILNRCRVDTDKAAHQARDQPLRGRAGHFSSRALQKAQHPHVFFFPQNSQ